MDTGYDSQPVRKSDNIVSVTMLNLQTGFVRCLGYFFANYLDIFTYVDMNRHGVVASGYCFRRYTSIQLHAHIKIISKKSLDEQLRF